MEYDPKTKQMIGMPKRFWRGGTDRGCIEAPHLTKHGEYYYIMCAEGGTGYYHSVTVGRSKNIFGPYEPDPCNPILTSNPVSVNERKDWDHLKPRYYNPDVKLQKAGHASYVDLPNGETWMVFHVSRPFVPELRCTLGRETAIQRMKWTEDGWLRTESGSNIAEEFVKPSLLPQHPLKKLPAHDDFDSPRLNIGYYAPRIDPTSFTDLVSRPGWAVFNLAKDIWNEEEAAVTEKEKYQNSIFFPVGNTNDAFAQYFIGQSYLAPLSTEQVPVFNVTFEPGCRNNWHIHKAKNGGGQMLICVGGSGYYQEWGKDAINMTPGSIINIPANVKHWHGAAPDSWFSHLAIEVPGEETGTEWCEPVSEEEYGKLK